MGPPWRTKSWMIKSKSWSMYIPHSSIETVRNPPIMKFNSWFMSKLNYTSFRLYKSFITTFYIKKSFITNSRGILHFKPSHHLKRLLIWTSKCLQIHHTFETKYGHPINFLPLIRRLQILVETILFKGFIKTTFVLVIKKNNVKQ